MAGKRGEDRGSSVSDSTNKLILKKAVHKKIEHIKSKAFISEREVYNLVRGFFKRYLGINYEFTHQELMKELKRIYLTPEMQKKVDSLFRRLSDIEHTSRTYSKPELVSIIDDFKGVVDELIVSHYQKQKSPFKRFMDSLHRLVSREHKKILKESEKGSVFSQDESVVVRMNMLLDNSQRWTDTDIEKAKQAYKELNHLYEELDPAGKKAYYTPLQELYNMIKTKSG